MFVLKKFVLNLNDSGVEVQVGLRESSKRNKKKEKEKRSERVRTLQNSRPDERDASSTKTEESKTPGGSKRRLMQTAVTAGGVHGF